MIKNLSFVLLVVVATVIGQAYCTQEQANPVDYRQDQVNYDDIPLASVPKETEDQAAAADQASKQGGGNFKDDLKGLFGTAYNAAGKAYEQTKPQLNVLHKDLMESYENIKKHPRVEYAKNKVAPFYQQGRSKIAGFLGKNHFGLAPQPNAGPVMPVRPEGVATAAEIAASDVSQLPEETVRPQEGDSVRVMQQRGRPTLHANY